MNIRGIMKTKNVSKEKNTREYNNKLNPKINTTYIKGDKTNTIYI